MRYVGLPGNTVARLPYVAHGAILHAMFFKSDEKILQRACDRILNEIAGDQLRWHVALPLVLVTAMYAKKMTSEDPIDKSKGYVEEADIGFWIGIQGGEIDKPWMWRDYWLPIYLFVDSGAALSAGREVFGYPKLYMNYRRENIHPDDDARVEVHTQHFEKFGPEEMGSFGPIFSIEQQSETALAQSITTQKKVANSLRTRFTATSGSRLRTALDYTPYSPVLPMIFLKQFRDLTRPNTACYQAITTVDTSPLPEPEPEYKPLSHSYALRFYESDSHPIAEDLGLADGQVADTDFSPFQYKMGFKVGFGSVLWEAKQ